MTIVAAIETPEYVYLAADRFIVDGNRRHQMHDTDSKIFKNGEYTFASAGRLRVNQSLKYAEFSEPDSESNDYQLWRFLSTTLASEIQETLKESGVETTRDNERLMTESELLVCVQGRVYAMGEDYSFTRAVPIRNSARASYLAIGSGADYAYGAAFAVDPLTPDQDVVKLMVDAAIKFDLYCGGEIDMLTELGVNSING